MAEKTSFNWDENSNTWCLSGTNGEGNYWETDDYEADDYSAAVQAAAEFRVDDDDELGEHRETIFADWPNWDEHMLWIATASKNEILAWAGEIESAGELSYEYALDIYQVVDGSDSWPLVETIIAMNPHKCLADAEKKYNQDEYHWTNPRIR